MWSRYKCPGCKADLKAAPPKPIKVPWYRFSPKYSLACPSCGVALGKRFANFDMALLTAISAGGGAVSVFGGFGKIVLKPIIVMFAIRFVLGRILSVYVFSKSDA